MAQQKAVEPVVDEVDDLIDELQPGAQLLKGQYTITRYLNSGGFGITYLAKDSLDRDVVIKECFPSSVCRRSKVVVAARSRAHTAELRSIVQLFVREARNLAKIVHPNIVAVHQVFEDNGTAYMAIDFIDGLDLQQIIDGEGQRPTPEHVVRITDKLLAAVGFIHDHDMLHRDISPDNVLIDKKGEPILIDFGAAREHASKTTRAMSALRVVKDGYSPQEFYIAGSEQGPWSDLYALAATIYHLISGDAPINGQARLASLAEDRPDPYQPLTGRFEGFPNGFLEAIDRAMSTLPKQRLQSATDWLAMYHAASAGSSPVVPAGVDDAVHRVVTDFQREDAHHLAEPPKAPIDAPPPLAKAASRQPEAVVAPVAGRDRNSPVQLVAGVVAALVVVATGYMFLGGQGNAPIPADTATATASPAATESVAGVAEAKPAAAAVAATAADPEPTAVTAAEPEAPVVATPVEEAPVVADAVVEAPVAESPVVETNVVKTIAAAVEAPVAEPAVAPVVEPATEAAAAEATPAAAPVAAASPAGKPAANQIAFAAWDAEIPFLSDDRMAGGKRVAVVTRIPPGVDQATAGDWLAPGVRIHAVNGVPIESAGSLTVAVMNAMVVDPDGMARVVVEYSDTTQQRKTGLLTVIAVRLVSLTNGVGASTSVIDGTWTTRITGIASPEATTLRQGDVLFRDKTTTAPLDGPTSLETILADLVAADATGTEFSIIRDNKVSAATMQLTLDKGQ